MPQHGTLVPPCHTLLSMARPLRIEYPGAFYHVLNRGQRQEAIVDDDRDRERFLLCLERLAMRYNVVVHTCCLMTNTII
jgi:putative transposase